AKILVDYDQKINQKNEKWLTQPLKLSKQKDVEKRIGTEIHQGIGEIDPNRKAEFDKYYEMRAPQMSPYLYSEEEVVNELPPVPTIIENKESMVSQERVNSKEKVNSGVNRMKMAFRVRHVADVPVIEDGNEVTR
ncbi:MAG: hypothetical protein MJ054_02425, partial [Clostridia bacterium]|nr:hypothetical protein [Clostridia bacterium]